MVRWEPLRRACGVIASALALALMVAAPAYADLIQGDVATSLRAGNETTGDLKTFKGKERGTFVGMQSEAGDFQVQTRRGTHGARSTKFVNKVVGVKINVEGDWVIYDWKLGRISCAGGVLDLQDGETASAPSGGQVERLGDTYVVTSEAGDEVSLTRRTKTTDVVVRAAPTRQDGELKGSLGALDSDTDPTNDLVDRNGNVMNDVDKFLDVWRTLPGESVVD